MNRHLRRHLEMERLFGADVLPLSRKRPSPPAPAAVRLSAPPPPARKNEAPPADPPEFQEFRSKVLQCTKCGLCKGRTQVVFGVGALGAPLMFVGEAPGQDEDEQGEPFVGRAGQLLTATLRKAGVRREQVYIANILKCRPPNNRTPQPDEMAACMPYLMKQIEHVKPKLLCALGNIAVQALLGSRTGITQLRGRYHDARGLKLFAAFHPAYVLRNMNTKTLFETDIAKVCRDSGL